MAGLHSFSGERSHIVEAGVAVGTLLAIGAIATGPALSANATAACPPGLVLARPTPRSIDDQIQTGFDAIGNYFETPTQPNIRAMRIASPQTLINREATQAEATEKIYTRTQHVNPDHVTISVNLAMDRRSKVQNCVAPIAGRTLYSLPINETYTPKVDGVVATPRRVIVGDWIVGISKKDNKFNYASILRTVGRPFWTNQ